ncbi:hypothetical protein CR513_12707, partial [Mucuna pruriens]
MSSLVRNCYRSIRPHHGFLHQRRPRRTKRGLKVMPSITYGTILTFGDFVMIESYAGASPTPRSIRSFNLVMQHLEAVIMDQLERPKKCLIVGSIDPPFLETFINSSIPAKNARK